MYVRAEILMLRKQNFSALRDFLPELNARHEKLMRACSSLIDTEIVRDTDWCKAYVIREKQEFDNYVLNVFAKAAILETPPYDRLSSKSRDSPSTRSTCTSTSNQQRKSQVKVKIAATAVTQEDEVLAAAPVELTLKMKSLLLLL